MIRQITQTQRLFLEERLRELLKAPPVPYSTLTPSKIPIQPGVYLITAILGETEHPYYVGRTKNLRERLYRNHLMGSPTNARLKKHMIDAGECVDLVAAKKFLRDSCVVRWIRQDGFRERGAVEGYVTGMLFPKYGIYEEH